MWDIIIQNLPTIILVGFAIIICGAELIKAIRVWKDERQRRIDARQQEDDEEEALQNTLQEILAALGSIDQKLTALETRVANAEVRLGDLTESDMNDIRAWIVEQYHKFYNHQGWIDAFSADTIDRRHKDYKKEGGNSYIDELVGRLHKLPMDPEYSINDLGTAHQEDK